MRPPPLILTVLYTALCVTVSGSAEHLGVTLPNVAFSKPDLLVSFTAAVASIKADRSLQARVLGHAVLVLQLTRTNALPASVRTRRHAMLPTPAKTQREHPVGFFSGIAVFNKRPIAMRTSTQVVMDDSNSTSKALIAYHQQDLWCRDAPSVHANRSVTEEAFHATTASTKAETVSATSSSADKFYRYTALISALLNIATFAAMGLYFAKQRRAATGEDDKCTKNAADPFGDGAYRYEAVLKRHNWNVWTVQQWEYTQEEQESFIAYLESCLAEYEKIYGSKALGAVPETSWWGGVGYDTCGTGRVADLLRQLENLYNHYGPAGLEGQVQEEDKEHHEDDYAHLALIPVSTNGKTTAEGDVGGDATDAYAPGGGQLIVYTNDGRQLVPHSEPGAVGYFTQTSSKRWALPNFYEQGIAVVITFTESRFVEEALGIVTEHITAALGLASAARIWHLFPDKLIFAVSFTRSGPTDALRLLAYITRLSNPGFVAWMPSHDAHHLLSRMLYGVEWGPDDLETVENLLFMDRTGTGEDIPLDDSAKWHILVVEMCQSIHAPSRPGIFKQIRGRRAHMVKDTPGLYIMHFPDVWTAMDFYNEVKYGYKWQSVFHQAAFPTEEACNTIRGLQFSPEGSLSEADLARNDVWEAVCFSLMPSLDKRPKRPEPFGDRELGDSNEEAYVEYRERVGGPVPVQVIVNEKNPPRMPTQEEMEEARLQAQMRATSHNVLDFLDIDNFDC